MALGLVTTLALTAEIHDAYKPPAPQAIPMTQVIPGFTVHLSTMDVLMINKALMLLPDAHAQETVQKVRDQVASQVTVPSGAPYRQPPSIGVDCGNGNISINGGPCDQFKVQHGPEGRRPPPQ